jgi:cytochrome c oxidase subunit 2
MLEYNLLYIALVALGLVFFGFIFASTRPSARAKPISVDAWKRREGLWLGVILVILLASLFATITKVPWSASAAADRQVVHVRALQYGFVFSTPAVRAGRQVEFDVTSQDVNHAFAVFDPSGRFIAQVQVMPGYTNVLRLTLRTAGTYTVRCFEYCGIGHHQMEQTFRVVA